MVLAAHWIILPFKNYYLLPDPNSWVQTCLAGRVDMDKDCVDWPLDRNCEWVYMCLRRELPLKGCDTSLHVYISYRLSDRFNHHNVNVMIYIRNDLCRGCIPCQVSPMDAVLEILP